MKKYRVYYTLWVEVDAENKKRAVSDAHDLLTEELERSHFDTDGIRPTEIKEQTNDNTS